MKESCFSRKTARVWFCVYVMVAVSLHQGKHNLVVALHNAFQKNSLIEEMPFKEIITIGLNSTSVGEFKDIGQVRIISV